MRSPAPRMSAFAPLGVERSSACVLRWEGAAFTCRQVDGPPGRLSLSFTDVTCMWNRPIFKWQVGDEFRHLSNWDRELPGSPRVPLCPCVAGPHPLAQSRDPPAAVSPWTTRSPRHHKHPAACVPRP